MGTQGKKWALMLAAVPAVVFVVMAAAWVRREPWTQWPAERARAAAAETCDQEGAHSHPAPTLEDLKSAEPTAIVLCRWQEAPRLGEHEVVSTVRLAGERRDRVVAALRHLREHEPELQPIDGSPDFFSLDLRGPGIDWRVQVPVNPREGIPLRDDDYGSWYTNGGLPRLLDSWVGR